MAQSYETNQRISFPVLGCFGWLLFLLMFYSGLATAQKPIPQDTRKAVVYPNYEYRFLVPKTQADAVWAYLVHNFGEPQLKAKSGITEIEEEHLTDLYFDTPGKELLRHNLALRQRLSISEEGIIHRIQLLLPSKPDSAFSYVVRFRQNKRPDKGVAFTTHPALKLLRTKDRPLLDSLLKPYNINATALETSMEINQDRRRLHILKNGNTWLNLTLTRLQVQAPTHLRIQLQIQADPDALKNASPATRRQLAQATDAMAKRFTGEFPELKREKLQEYAVMEQMQQRPAKQKVSAKAVFAATFIVLFLVVLLYRKFRKKPIQGFN